MNTRLIRLTLLGAMLSITAAVTAQETLPPYHWANPYIDYLKVRGFLPALSVSERPFHRGEVTRQLLQIDWEERDWHPRERGMVRLLLREFRREAGVLATSKEQRWKTLLQKAADFLELESGGEDARPLLKAGIFGEITGRDTRQENGELHFTAHPQAGLFWRDFLTIYQNFRVFDRAAPNYIGKEYKNLFGYVEQGYVAVKDDWYEIKFGRDFMQLGPGRSAQLLFSANSRPFDMYQVQLGKSFLKFSFWGIRLDNVINRQPTQFAARRQINGHRLSFNFGNKAFVGVSEVVLYGGANRGWDLAYMNPAGFYYFVNVNQEAGDPPANLLYNVDWDLYLHPNLELYGEFLIDDYQVDRAVPGDLEPNELGLLLGVNWANPARLAGTVVNAEYTQVRNRTYNVADSDWGKYLHRNEEIGHFLGNNFERYELGATHWLRPDLYVKISSSITRQGEGSVAGEFNTDFVNATLEEGYDEPFPFGVVERHWRSGMQIFYQPRPAGHIRLDVGYSDFRNFHHVEGRKYSDFTVDLSLWVQWNRLWK